MKISVGWLTKKHACYEAVKTFIDKFGENAEIDEKEIIQAIKTMGRRDWGLLLLNWISLERRMAGDL